MRVYRYEYVCVVRCVFDLILLLHDHAMYFYCVLEVKSEKTVSFCAYHGAYCVRGRHQFD